MPGEVAALADRIAGLGSGRRIVALAGAPGSGKSTLAEALGAELDARGRTAAILPMDGFHYDDALLATRGLLPRKGAPETFDIGGLAHLLDRLRRNAEAEVAVPVFDRGLELSRNAARLIPKETDVVIAEGNYLLLDRPGWRDLGALFDLTVALDVPQEVLRARLLERWAHLPPAEAAAKVEVNDLPNGRAVRDGSRLADVVLRLPG